MSAEPLLEMEKGAGMIEFRDYSSVLGRVLGLIKEHRVRLIAGLVLVIGGIFIGVAPFMSRAIWIVLLSPVGADHRFG